MGAVSLDRRRFLQGGVALAGLGLLNGCGTPFGPWAQTSRLRRVGYLAAGTPASAAPTLEALRQGLRDHGYVEGETAALELRYAEGREEPYRALADELVNANVDLIITGGNVATRAVQRATATIPIVFAAADDPVRDGLVASLARPGGNTTGLALNAGEEGAKRVQLFREAVPGMSRLAILWTPAVQTRFRETEAAAQALGMQVLSLELRDPDDLDAVLAGALGRRADGLLAQSAVLFIPLAPRVVAFAASHWLPLMGSSSTWWNAGAMMSYGTNIAESWRSAAGYVDKILKGANPADLPVERPTKSDFGINMKTARELGLTIPQSVLQQATEIVE
jgi:putative tryptophan/tyrosine transport system substrate-binding protein